MANVVEQRKKNVTRELAETKLREAELIKTCSKLEGGSKSLREQLAASELRALEKARLCEDLQQHCRGLDRERAVMAMSTSTAQCELREASLRERHMAAAAMDQRVRQGSLENAEAQALARAVDAQVEAKRLGDDLEMKERDNRSLQEELVEAQAQNRSFRMRLGRLEKEHEDLLEDHTMQTETLRSAVENCGALAMRVETLEDELRVVRASLFAAVGAADPLQRSLPVPAAACSWDRAQPLLSSRVTAGLHHAAVQKIAQGTQSSRDSVALHSLHSLGPMERLPPSASPHSGSRQDYPRTASTRGVRARILHDLLSTGQGAKPHLPPAVASALRTASPWLRNDQLLAASSGLSGHMIGLVEAWNCYRGGGPALRSPRWP
eukprot:CAMPEP_0177483764 /NCGR_PEP_ID=MMETSP0369-20130122/27656_1 /TAXON_ID=447022 ORGANISM="Scrippsiella hangoei-like, Strain SHHI-4" /NCGR_SAMPLE_ID=MMETSP0369 /ASSEMBLY_ACC=CAM_ASM_000364 /LENGTH=379 /DNA_ID=CAMNT_0018959807 /DNA_START=80 /DNA_END=1216 /DNA_ORIENTATION=-